MGERGVSNGLGEPLHNLIGRKALHLAILLVGHERFYFGPGGHVATSTDGGAIEGGSRVRKIQSGFHGHTFEHGTTERTMKDIARAGGIDAIHLKSR